MWPVQRCAWIKAIRTDWHQVRRLEAILTSGVPEVSFASRILSALELEREHWTYEEVAEAPAAGKTAVSKVIC